MPTFCQFLPKNILGLLRNSFFFFCLEKFDKKCDKFLLKYFKRPKFCILYNLALNSTTFHQITIYGNPLFSERRKYNNYKCKYFFPLNVTCTGTDVSSIICSCNISYHKFEFICSFFISTSNGIWVRSK